MVIHTVKLFRPDAEQTAAMWKLLYAADAVEDRWSRGSTVRDLMQRLNNGELSRDERRFIMRAWSVLVDGHLGFSRFLCTFEALIATFQDPSIDYVQAKPELEQMADDAELLPIYEEAYKEAVTNADREFVVNRIAGQIIQLAAQHVMEKMKIEQGELNNG